MGCAAVRRPEGRRPVLGAQPDLAPVGLDGHALCRRFLIESDGHLDGVHQVRRCLESRHRGVGFDLRLRTLRHKVSQGACPHSFFSETGKDIGDVSQVGLVWADEQHAAPLMAQARVRVEEVGGSVQCDNGFAGARPAVDDECAARSAADDRVLIRRDRAQDVAHLGRPVLSQTCDERRLVIERCAAFGVCDHLTFHGEDLIPVVGDLLAGPSVASASGQAHRIGMGGTEKRLGDGGAPVDHQLPPRAVRQSQPPDIHRFGTVRAHHVPETQVHAEPPQCAQTCSEPVHLHVPIHGRPALASRRLPFSVDAIPQVRYRLFQTPRDLGEMVLIVRDQCGIGFACQVVGQVENTGGQRFQALISSDGSASRRLAATARKGRMLAVDSEFAPSTGSCRKPLGAL